jgi:hypothetical protein
MTTCRTSRRAHWTTVLRDLRLCGFFRV